MSGAPLIALWPSGFAYLLPMNQGAQKTHSPTYSHPPPSSTFYSPLWFYPFSVRQPLIPASFHSDVFPPQLPPALSLFFHCLSLRDLDLASCIPSCLIKVCIINTAISLSIPLPCSYDCYIKCKLFRCNSPLMSLL